jgi:hypothetical protein
MLWKGRLEIAPLVPLVAHSCTHAIFCLITNAGRIGAAGQYQTLFSY